MSGEDSDQTRVYLGLRFGESNPALDAHDAAGLSLGGNLSRYLGAELAMDTYEFFLNSPGRGKVGELGVLGFVPEVRARYPLLGNRLTPYLLGGAGVAVTQVNDGVTPISLSGGGSTKARFLGSVGGGLEYFIADDIALGVEGKYMFTGSDSFTAGETTTSIDLNTALLTFGMRLFYPELHPEVSSYSASRAARRFYVSMRAGGALPVHTVVFPGVKATPEQDVFGSNFSLLYAVSMGVHLTPWLDLELSGSNYELDLSFTESPQTTEYTVFPVLLQPRIHWPVRNARLDPYALAGIGAEIVEVNDKTDPTTEVHGTGVAVIGALGLGLDYFVTKNIAFGLETKYIFSRGHTLQLEDGPVLGGNLDSLVISIGVRAFLFGF